MLTGSACGAAQDVEYASCRETCTARKYLLIWQTTRALYGDVSYILQFNAGASAAAKADAIEKVSGIGGSLSVTADTGNTVTIDGKQLFLGLSPLYYEQWFSESLASNDLHDEVEAVALQNHNVVAAIISGSAIAQALNSASAVVDTAASVPLSPSPTPPDSGTSTADQELLKDLTSVETASQTVDEKIDGILGDGSP